MAGPLEDAKATGPKGKTGNLKKSIKKKMETPNKRNKGVYRIAYDPKYDTMYFKSQLQAYMAVNTPYAYYPASVEYGYKDQSAAK